MDHSSVPFIGCKACQAHIFPLNCPFPFGDRHPHATHCSSVQAHLSSRTASRLVQPFCMGSKSYAIHCIVSGEENLKNCPFPLGFRHPAGEAWQRSHMSFSRYRGGQTDTHRHGHHNTLPWTTITLNTNLCTQLYSGL